MTGRVLNRAAAGLVLVALCFGVPVMLAFGFGWPLPSRLPSWDEVAVVLTSPPSERLLVNTVAVLCWLLWVSFITSVAADLAWMARHGPRRPERLTPARGLTFALLAALLTGSFGGTAAAVVSPAPGVVVEVAAPPAATATAQEATGAVAAAKAEQPVVSADLGPAGAMRRIALWEDAPTILPDPTASAPVLVQVGQARHTIDVAPGDTLWDLAEAWLGDPARWPEIHELNRDRYQLRGGGHIEPGWTLELPADAAPPAAQPTSQAGTPEGGHDEDGEDGGPELVHQVASGDWMWHIAGRYLGDEQRYLEIAELNPNLADRHPGFPDHIQPGDELLLPDDAQDLGIRSHATGQAVPASTAGAGPPAAAPEPAPPEPPPERPAIPAPSDNGHDDPPATPGRQAPTPPAASAPEPDAGPAAGPEDEQQPDPAPEPVVGVSLPSGAWVSLGLAALIATAALVLRLHRRRRTRLVFPIPTGTGPAPSPVPESLRSVDAAGVRVLDFDHTDILLPGLLPAPAKPAAVGVDAGGGQVSLFDLPGPVVSVVGDGAAAAVRAMLAAAISTGVAEHMGVQPHVVIPADTFASLLPPGTPPVGLDPNGEAFDGERLVVTADVASAVTRCEEEMIYRRRMLDGLAAESIDQLWERDEYPEHLPPHVLIVGPGARYLPRVRAVATHRDDLHLHAVVLGELDEIAAVRVEADGTVAAGPPPGGADRSGAAVARLSTLTPADLADVLALVAQVAPRPEAGADPTDDQEPTGGNEPADEPEPPAGPAAGHTAGPVPSPAGDQPPPVRLRVLGEVGLSIVAGPVTDGVRTGSLAVMALLAAHPEGRGMGEIAATLHPGEDDRDAAANRVRTDMSAARAALRQATGLGRESRFITYHERSHRYGLDPDLLEVDLWQMLAAVQAANRHYEDEQACLAGLRRAGEAYGGDFGADLEQAWTIGYATTFRATVVSVRARIAEILETDQPDEAVAELELAIGIDAVNEELYQRLMRIHGRHGRTDEVRATMRRLERALAEVGDIEPSQATRRVAARQLSGPARRPAREQAGPVASSSPPDRWQPSGIEPSGAGIQQS